MKKILIIFLTITTIGCQKSKNNGPSKYHCHCGGPYVINNIDYYKIYDDKYSTNNGTYGTYNDTLYYDSPEEANQGCKQNIIKINPKGYKAELSCDIQ